MDFRGLGAAYATCLLVFGAVLMVAGWGLIELLIWVFHHLRVIVVG